MPDDNRDNSLHAARITAAALRFDIERLPANSMALPHDQPGRLGEVAFILFPDATLVPSEMLAGHLAALPKPVLLAALAHKGFIGAWQRDGQPERALAAWDHNVANAQAAMDRKLKTLNIGDGDPVLVATRRERFHVSAHALRYWAANYRVDVLWSVTALENDPHARAQLVFIRGDGVITPPPTPKDG